MSKIKQFFKRLFTLWRFREEVFIDPVAGIHNRLYFEETVKQEIARARRYDADLCLVMIDVDYFKRINDQFGHAMGDQVLRKVGEILTEKSRGSDIIARWGGDEFIMLLPETSEGKASVLLTRIRRSFKEYIKEEGLPAKTNLSFGAYSWSGEDLTEAWEKADAKMYQHKEHAR